MPPTSALTADVFRKSKGSFLAAVGSGGLGKSHDDRIEEWIIVTCKPKDLSTSIADVLAAGAAGQDVLVGRETHLCIETWGTAGDYWDVILEIWKSSTPRQKASRSADALNAIGQKLLSAGYICTERAKK